jgi:hypothetical protein
VHGCQARTKRPILRARREKLCPAGFIDPWEGGSRTVQRSVPRGLCLPGAPGFFLGFWGSGFRAVLRDLSAGCCCWDLSRAGSCCTQLDLSRVGSCCTCWDGRGCIPISEIYLSLNMQIVGAESKSSLRAGCTGMQAVLCPRVDLVEVLGKIDQSWWQWLVAASRGGLSHDRNEDPFNGCQIGTKCPILHAK